MFTTIAQRRLTRHRPPSCPNSARQSWTLDVSPKFATSATTQSARCTLRMSPNGTSRLCLAPVYILLMDIQPSSKIHHPQYHTSPTSARSGSAAAITNALLHPLYADQEQVYNGRQRKRCFQRLPNGKSMSSIQKKDILF